MRGLALCGVKQSVFAALAMPAVCVAVPGASAVLSFRLSGWVVRDLVGSGRFWVEFGWCVRQDGWLVTRSYIGWYRQAEGFEEPAWVVFE
jgi:hypothetical protein